MFDFAGTKDRADKTISRTFGTEQIRDEGDAVSQIRPSS
jgi:hypothetical protein